MPPGDSAVSPTALLCHRGQRRGQGRVGTEPGKGAETPQDLVGARHGAPAMLVGAGTVWDAGPSHPSLRWENGESSALPGPSGWLASALPERGPEGMPGRLLHQRSRRCRSPGCCRTRAWDVRGCEWRGRAGCRNATRGSELCLLGWDSVSLPMEPRLRHAGGEGRAVPSLPPLPRPEGAASLAGHRDRGQARKGRGRLQEGGGQTAVERSWG